MKNMELKDLPEQQMVVQYVFSEEDVPVGSVIRHYHIDHETDNVRLLHVGIVTSVDNYFINYSSYSHEDEEMRDYSIHHSNIYIKGLPDVNERTSAYVIVDM